MTIPTIMPSTTAKAGSLLCHNPTASGNNSANTTYNMAPEARLSTTASAAGLIPPTANPSAADEAAWGYEPGSADYWAEQK